MTEAEIKEAAIKHGNESADFIMKNIRAQSFIAGAEANAPKWIPVTDALPEAVDKKMTPVLAINGTFRVIVYYFPYHFKTVEWEDWDDYTEEDFPYTEADNENGIVWLRPGFYQSVDCEKCDGYWSSPLPVTHWMPLPSVPSQQNTQP